MSPKKPTQLSFLAFLLLFIACQERRIRPLGMLAAEKLALSAVFSASIRVGVPADGYIPSDAREEYAMLPELSTDTITFGAGSLTAVLRGAWASGYCAACPAVCASTRPHSTAFLENRWMFISIFPAMLNSPS
jgi:hypothetical protein